MKKYSPTEQALRIARNTYAGGGEAVKKALDALRGGNKVFPKPQRMFPADARPPGGEYINAATGEAITGQKPARAVIGVTPEGKPLFLTDTEQVEATGSPGPGSTKTKTNLFKQQSGWKWNQAPEGYENVPTIVSAENRGQHYYGLGADFPKGVDLERYANATSEPRLRPTTQGNVYPGEQVGSIDVRGREHPVYDMLTIRNLLAGTAAALYQTMNPDGGQAQAATPEAPVAAPNASQASGWNAGPSVPQQQTGIGAVSRQLSDWGERTANDVGDIARYTYNNPGEVARMVGNSAADAAKWAVNNPGEAGGKAVEMVASGIPKFVPSVLWGTSGLLNPDPANGGEDTDALIARLKAKQSEQGQPDQTYQGYADGGEVEQPDAPADQADAQPEPSWTDRLSSIASQFNPVGNAEAGTLGSELISKGLKAARAAAAKVQEYKDPVANKIVNWNWRPLADVHSELGLTEIPPHVQSFGDYMLEMGDKAGTEGLTPRDLIKGYTTTRASIQRQAVDADRLRQLGLDIPGDVEKVRPEGAWSEWLGTPMGQRYLDAASKGNIDSDSVADAVRTMAPFGRHTTDVPQAMTWAAQNLPGREAVASDLVSRGAQGASSPEEWRKFTSDIHGVGPAKSGFLAALYGRGDQPTLDARQLILNTGQPTKMAQPWLRSGATEAVDRLAARQRALALAAPSKYDPLYQHLAHHTIWDKASNEMTTHGDVIKSMRNYADGGDVQDQTDAPTDATPEPSWTDAPTDATPEPSWTDKLSNFASQFNPIGSAEAGTLGSIARAVRAAKGVVPKVAEDTGTYWSDLAKTKHLIPVEEMSATHVPSTEMLPRTSMSPEDLQGSILTPAAGDRTMAGHTLTAINEKPLAYPVQLEGGPDFMREAANQAQGSVWASHPSVISSMARYIRKLGDTGKDLNMVYSANGARNGDFSTMMSDALLAQLPGSKIPKASLKEFNSSMKAQNPNWPGLKGTDPDAVAIARQVLMNNAPMRKQFVEEMALKGYQENGFPEIGSTRYAITEPALIGQPTGVSGYAISRLDPSAPVVHDPLVPHSTYRTQMLANGYRGGLDAHVPRNIMFPDFYKMRRAAGAPVKADDRAFTMSDVSQNANQQWLDGIMQYLRSREN